MGGATAIYGRARPLRSADRSRASTAMNGHATRLCIYLVSDLAKAASGHYI